MLRALRKDPKEIDVLRAMGIDLKEVKLFWEGINVPRVLRMDHEER